MMEIVTAIVTNYKFIAEALEKQMPVIQKLADKIVERVHRGGRIFCLAGESDVPASYLASEGFFMTLSGLENQDSFTAAWDWIHGMEASEKDVVLAVDNPDAVPFLTGGVRDTRRKGFLTVCICCSAASVVASAAEHVVLMDVDPVGERRQLVEKRAEQVALDAILTIVLARLEPAGLEPNDGPGDENGMIGRAVKALMNEIPGLEEAEAEHLLAKFGTVKRAVAYIERFGKEVLHPAERCGKKR